MIRYVYKASAATATAATTTRWMRATRALVAMARPSQIALILAVLTNGILLGLWRSGAEPDPARLVWSFALTFLAAVAVHLANEAADVRTDRLTERTPFSGGSGALGASRLRPRVPLRLARGTAVVVALASLASIPTGLLSTTAVVLMLGGVGGGLAYSLRPVAAVRRGWGEPLNAVLGALMLPLFGVATVSGTVSAIDGIAFLPFFFVALASVMATAWADRDADAASGKATLQVRIAPRTLRTIHAATSASFVVATALSVALDAMPLAVAGLVVLPALILGTLRYTRRRSPLANVAAMVTLALLTTGTMVLSLAGTWA